MLVYRDKTFTKKDLTRKGALPALEPLLTKHRVQRTGRAYLRSIVEAESKHYYKDHWKLVTSLVLRDYLAGAARTANRPVYVPFSANQLDSQYWRKRDRFYARTADGCTAVRAVARKKAGNRLECLSLVHLILLYAYTLACGRKQFNLSFNARIKGRPLSIPMNGELYETELLDLKAEPGMPAAYKGDGVFRPGDMVTFSCYMTEGVDPRKYASWQAENALCVGWKWSAQEPQYNEPIFAGGGFAGETFTEAELKWGIYEQIGKPSAYGSEDNVKRVFSRKALGPTSARDPYIELLTTVTRIKVLGGRRDLPP